MTLTEFNNNRFGSGDNAIYDGEEYPIYQVDFKEQLIGLKLNISGGDEDDITWVRCENIYYIPFKN